MNTTRQDAWTKDEDILLAETVLRYIREGKTQLEAFKDVAEKLSRTSAACGFRWNATIRKKYENAIRFAKEARKKQHMPHDEKKEKTTVVPVDDPLETAILLLKKMKVNASDHQGQLKDAATEELAKLRKENKELKAILLRYEEAWKEM